MLSSGSCSARAIVGTAVLSTVVSSDSIRNAIATSQGRNRLAIGFGCRNEAEECNWDNAMTSLNLAPARSGEAEIAQALQMPARRQAG